MPELVLPSLISLKSAGRSTAIIQYKKTHKMTSKLKDILLIP